MTAAILEHVNVTVHDPDKTAAMLCTVFGWHIRWQGPSQMGGFTIHVGGDTSYLALYKAPDPMKPAMFDDTHIGNLNHVAVTVDDLKGTEKQVKAAGYVPHNHGDYEPGKRFYFNDEDGIEYEVVSYA